MPIPEPEPPSTILPDEVFARRPDGTVDMIATLDRYAAYMKAKHGPDWDPEDEI